MSHLPAISPFKLLQSYDKSDVKVYFGREKETRLLAEALKRGKFLLLYGASGTGKTSLIQCGLQGMFSARDWMPIFIRRGTNFLDSMRMQLREAYQIRFQLRYPGQPISLPPDLPLRELVKALFNLSYVPIYLVLDQFEEIFTLGDAGEQQAFFEALSEFRLFEEDLFCKLLIVVREEYIAHFYAYENQLPFLFENRFRVEKMRREQLLKVVEGTLQYQYEGYPPFVLEAGAGEQILHNLTDAKGETDLTDLQVLLDRLYREAAEKRPESDAPVVFDKALAGNTKIENVLSEFLERQIEQADQRLLLPGGMKAAQPIALVILFKLVTPEGTKQNRAADAILQELALGKTAVDVGQLTAYLTLLISPEMRLLNRLKFTGSADEYYEIWHDRLAAQVFKQFSADEIRQREALVTLKNKKKRFDNARADLKKQHAEYLSIGELELIGQSLNIARIDPEQRAFYEQSTLYRRRQRRKEQLLLAGALVAAVVFAALAAIAWYAWQRSEISRLYNEGLVESVRNPTTGLQKIIAAHQRDPDDVNKRKGAWQVYANNLLYDSVFCEKSGPLNAAAFSPDGRLFVTAVKSVIRLYRTGEKIPRDSATANNAVKYLTFRGNDTLLAASEDRKVYLFAGLTAEGRLSKFRDIDTQKGVQRDEGLQGFATDKNGQWLATTHNQPFAQLWNLQSGVWQQTLATDNNVSVTALSPDGRWWAAGTDFGEIILQPMQDTAALTARNFKIFMAEQPVAVSDLSFSPDGQTLAAALKDGSVVLWKTAVLLPDAVPDDSLQRLFTLSGTILTGQAALTDLEFSGDGLLLLAAADNGTGYVLDVTTRRPVFALLGHSSPLLRAQFTDQQDELYTAAADGTLLRWAFPRPFPDQYIATGTFGTEQALFSSDGKYVAVRAADSIIQIFDGKSFQKTAQYAQHDAATTALAVGETSAVSGDEQGWIHLWQLADAAQKAKTRLDDKPVVFLSTDRTGTTVLAAGGDSTAVWLRQPVTANVVKIGPPLQLVAALAVSPDGQMCLVANYDSTVTRYDHTGAIKGQMRLPWVPTALYCDKKNNTFTVAGPDDKAFQYVFGNGSPIRKDLPARTGIAWTGDAAVYATFDQQSGTNRQCAIQTYTAEGFMIQAFRYNNCDLTSFALRPDGQVLAATASDGTLLIWKVRRSLLSGVR